MLVGEAILQLTAAALLLALIFRGLSSGRVRLPEAVRLAAGSLAVYITMLAMLWFQWSPWILLVVTIAVAICSVAIEGQGLSRLTDAMGRLRLPLYLLSVVAVAGLVLVLLPVTTFLTSPSEFAISLKHLVTVGARAVVLVVYVAAILYLFAFTPRMRTLLTLIALTVLGLAVAYAFVLPMGYPSIAGLTFEEVALPGVSLELRAVVDAVLIPVVVLVIAALLLRFGARSMLVAVVLVNVSLLSLAMIRGSQAEAQGAIAAAAARSQHQEQPLRFSTTQPNVLIVFLDRFMGSFVESILRSDPDLLQRLHGFTWYPRTVSAGHNSIAGVHPMLGGYDYTPVEMNARGESLREQSIEAFSILPYNFAKKKYRVNLLNPRGLGFTNEGDCSVLPIEGITCTHFPESVVQQRADELGFKLTALPESAYADLLSLLAAMRSGPYLVKHIVFKRGNWFPFGEHSMNTGFREWAQLQALPEMSVADAQGPSLNYVTSLLPHESYFLDEDCKPRHTRLVVSDEEVQRRDHISLYSLQHAIGARCSLLGVANYLDFLKSAGVYDNTKIVIVSDHGIHGLTEDQSTRAVAGGTTGVKFVGSRSVLLIKERDAGGLLKISEEFMPNAETPRIVCEEIGGCVNPYLNDKAIAAHGRDDPFYVSLVPWQFGAQKPTAFVIEEQRALKGKDPFDARGWMTLE